MRAVLSIGSNLGDRRAHLQSVIDGLGGRVVAASPVYETDAWGGVDQGPFLNAVLIAHDPDYDGYDWLRHGQRLEAAADRVREVHWGPRTLDVDIVSCYRGGDEVHCRERDLTLPHPYARQRAFVLVPWLAVDPAATLSGRPVSELLAQIDPAERAGVRPTDLALAC